MAQVTDGINSNNEVTSGDAPEEEVLVSGPSVDTNDDEVSILGQILEALKKLGRNESRDNRSSNDSNASSASRSVLVDNGRDHGGNFWDRFRHNPTSNAGDGNLDFLRQIYKKGSVYRSSSGTGTFTASQDIYETQNGNRVIGNDDGSFDVDVSTARGVDQWQRMTREELSRFSRNQNRSSGGNQGTNRDIKNLNLWEKIANKFGKSVDVFGRGVQTVGNVGKFVVHRQAGALGNDLKNLSTVFGGSRIAGLLKFFKGGPIGWLTGAAVAGYGLLKFMNAQDKRVNNTRSDSAKAGRGIIGSNLSFRDVANAIRIGRSHGVNDSEVIGNLQTMAIQQAAAMYGKGDLQNRLGEFGISPLGKSPEEVLKAISREYGSLMKAGKKERALLLLNTAGYRPDQAEYVANYAEKSEWGKNLEGEGGGNIGARYGEQKTTRLFAQRQEEAKATLEDVNVNRQLSSDSFLKSWLSSMSWNEQFKEKISKSIAENSISEEDALNRFAETGVMDYDDKKMFRVDAGFFNGLAGGEAPAWAFNNASKGRQSLVARMRKMQRYRKSNGVEGADTDRAYADQIENVLKILRDSGITMTHDMLSYAAVSDADFRASDDDVQLAKGVAHSFGKKLLPKYENQERPDVAPEVSEGMEQAWQKFQKTITRKSAKASWWADPSQQEKWDKHLLGADLYSLTKGTNFSWISKNDEKGNGAYNALMDIRDKNSKYGVVDDFYMRLREKGYNPTFEQLINFDPESGHIEGGANNTFQSVIQEWESQYGKPSATQSESERSGEESSDSSSNRTEPEKTTGAEIGEPEIPVEGKMGWEYRSQVYKEIDNAPDSVRELSHKKQVAWAIERLKKRGVYDTKDKGRFVPRKAFGRSNNFGYTGDDKTVQPSKALEVESKPLMPEETEQAEFVPWFATRDEKTGKLKEGAIEQPRFAGELLTGNSLSKNQFNLAKRMFDEQRLHEAPEGVDIVFDRMQRTGEEPYAEGLISVPVVRRKKSAKKHGETVGDASLDTSFPNTPSIPNDQQESMTAQMQQVVQATTSAAESGIAADTSPQFASSKTGTDNKEGRGNEPVTVTVNVTGTTMNFREGDQVKGDSALNELKEEIAGAIIGALEKTGVYG